MLALCSYIIVVTYTILMLIPIEPIISIHLEPKEGIHNLEALNMLEKYK